MVQIKVEIYHNVAPDGGGFFGLNAVFENGSKREARTPDERHPLVKVFECEAEIPQGLHGWIHVCESAFDAFNFGADEISQRYRARRLRSLSVGDVVILGADIDPVAYSCERLGFKERSPDELRIVSDYQPEWHDDKTGEPIVTVPWED